jgi:transposase-like protein
MAISGMAEVEADLIRQRTREGMAIARAQGKLKGRQRKLSPVRQRSLVREYEPGEENIVELAKSFGVSRPTVYRALARHAAKASSSPATPVDTQPFLPSGDQVPTSQPEVELPTRREGSEPLSAGLDPVGPPEVAPTAKTTTPEVWAADWAAADDEAHDQFLYVEGLGKHS